MLKGSDNVEKLRDAMEALERIKDQRKLDKRMYIVDTDPNAPICIRCRYCQQEGFLFICPLFALPEDEKVVGLDGLVYYKRKGHKPKTYPNTPMNDNECDVFEEMQHLTKEELQAIEHQYSATP